MGSYLTAPIRTKEKEQGSSSKFEYAAVSMQGWRIQMEDAHIAQLSLGDQADRAIFGVFDGHGGKEMALLVKEKFIPTLLAKKNYENGQFKAALEETFLEMDDIARSESGKEVLKQSRAGCTANVILIIGKTIYCANSGDSRSIVMKNGEAVALSVDHKPDDPIEKARVENAGGYVIEGRINRNLNLSRAFGDLEYKVNDKNPQDSNPRNFMITAFPDVTETTLTDDIPVIILGCDGIWECRSNQFIAEYFAKDGDLTNLGENFLDLILAPNTNTTYGLDNMSLIAVRIKK